MRRGDAMTDVVVEWETSGDQWKTTGKMRTSEVSVVAPQERQQVGEEGQYHGQKRAPWVVSVPVVKAARQLVFSVMWCVRVPSSTTTRSTTALASQAFGTGAGHGPRIFFSMSLLAGKIAMGTDCETVCVSECASIVCASVCVCVCVCMPDTAP